MSLCCINYCHTHIHLQLYIHYLYSQWVECATEDWLLCFFFCLRLFYYLEHKGNKSFSSKACHHCSLSSKHPFLQFFSKTKLPWSYCSVEKNQLKRNKTKIMLKIACYNKIDVVGDSKYWSQKGIECVYITAIQISFWYPHSNSYLRHKKSKSISWFTSLLLTC